MSRCYRDVAPFLRKSLNSRIFNRSDTLDLQTECGEHIGFITKNISSLISKYNQYFEIQPDRVILQGTSFDHRTSNMKEFAEDVKHNWPSLARDCEFSLNHLGWRNELYTVYPKTQHPLNYDTKLFDIERCLCKFLSIQTYGVHVNCFTRKEDGLYLWVGRRSPTKPTFPNLVDQCVAGKEHNKRILFLRTLVDT